MPGLVTSMEVGAAQSDRECPESADRGSPRSSCASRSRDPTSALSATAPPVRSGKGYLAVSILDQVSPMLRRLEGLPLDRPIEHGGGRLLLVGGEILGVELLPDVRRNDRIWCRRSAAVRALSDASSWGGRRAPAFRTGGHAPPEMIATSTVPSNRAEECRPSRASRSRFALCERPVEIEYHETFHESADAAVANFGIARSHRKRRFPLVPLHRGFDGFKVNGGLGGPRARP